VSSVLIPVPDRDFDPTEVAASWQMLTQAGNRVIFADPADFRDVPPGSPDFRLKTSGLRRDTSDDARPAFVVDDGNYRSARWPGDTYTFAKTFARKLSAAREPQTPAS
jgi:hypothetical protein